ncbi:DegQ family serine endoprotease [Telmatospirillum siberiense]|uniref:Probable periplasmic serine endoprotease DegP-like n=1 Tax=Telmatospirillum siberiense TaxID=382514 RepID=A0A2N3Q1N9_9PROT|nr:DegQ family serine endoprotease [Telmatospirillum siberiense]PKU26580.1 serine protease [Telmatospirillum siberiense]
MPHSLLPKKSAFAAALLAGSILAGGLVPSLAQAQSPEPQQAAPVVNQAGFSDLVKKVRPAVVNIATLEMPHQTDMRDMPQLPPGSPFADMFKQFYQHRNARPEHALGSGFLVDPAGYIVTNNHVVDGAHKITVTLDDGTNYPAKVVGRDAKTDLALLKVDAKKPLPFVAFGDSDQEQVGDWVIAVGNPFGLGGSVTAGIVSAHGRNINEGPYDDFLQIDAPINPGNSGGPLFNQSGQVIGIDTAIYSPNGGSVGIGFAIPSRIASKVVTALREHGQVERGWLGVQMQSLTPALAKAVGRTPDDGVIVSDVLADSPALHAGLKQGDVITGYDGKPIKTPRDLALAVADTASGKSVPMSVWRDGREQTVDVRVGTQAKEQTASNDAEDGSGPLGMALEPLSKEARSELGLGSSVKGVVVAQVEPGSRADDSGIQPGDVIVRIGDVSVTSPNQAAGKIHEAEAAKKEAVPLLVTRNGTTYYIALQLTQG